MEKEAVGGLHNASKERAELYPDLVMFHTDLKALADLGVLEVKALANVLEHGVVPEMLCEWKFTSYKAPQPHRIREDLQKLHVLGEFVRARTGRTPELLQVFFNFAQNDPDGLTKRVKDWFAGPKKLSVVAPGVTSMMFLQDGDSVMLNSPST